MTGFWAVWDVVLTLLVVGTGLLLVLRWAAVCGAPIRVLSVPAFSGKTGCEVSARTCLKVFGAALALRLAVFLLGALIAAQLGLLENSNPLDIWERWDGWHYVRLVELGYDGYIEDGQHLFLVFYPLYVWITRLVRFVVGNTVLSGLIVSWLSYAGGCVYLYRLAALDYGEAVAAKTIWYLSIFPYAFFFGSVMTEGLFFLTTSAGLWHIRRHQWYAAGLWGILAALTRMHGLLLIGAAAAELCMEQRLFTPDARSLWTRIKGVAVKLPALLLPLLGAAGYLMLNEVVDGNPFAFTIHQQHWSQGFLWISRTLGYLVRNAISYPSLAVRWELWIPEVLLFPLFFALLVWAGKRCRSPWTLYAFVTLVLDYSLSWLLSAGRYLSCALPFFLFAALLTDEKPRWTAALSAGMLVCFLLLLTGYLAGGQIM